MNISDESTSRGTLRDEGLAAAPLLLRVLPAVAQRTANNVEQRRAPGGAQRKAGAVAPVVEPRRAQGRRPQRKAGTAAPVSTVNKMELKKKLSRRARRKKQVKWAADPTTPPARKAGLGAPVESPAPPSPDVEVLIKKNRRAPRGARVVD